MRFLRDEQPVERIALLRGRRGGVQSMSMMDRKGLIPVRAIRGGMYSSGASGGRGLPRPCLIAIAHALAAESSNSLSGETTRARPRRCQGSALAIVATEPERGHGTSSWLPIE